MGGLIGYNAPIEWHTLSANAKDLLEQPGTSMMGQTHHGSVLQAK
jgi:hypothetical protein